MQVNQLVAENLRAARVARGWSQARLAEEMSRAGADWTRGVCAYAESGRRNITVDDLLALAIVFSTTPAYWLIPPSRAFEDGPPNVRAGDTEVPALWLVATAAAGDAAPPLETAWELSPWRRFFEVLARLAEREGPATPSADLLQQTLGRLGLSGSLPREINLQHDGPEVAPRTQ